MLSVSLPSLMSDLQTLLTFTDSLIHVKTGKHLSDLQRAILAESLQASKKTYQQIAEIYNYSPKYIQQVVASRLWQLLSNELGEKVTKTNVRSVLERHITGQKLLPDEIDIPPAIKPVSILLLENNVLTKSSQAPPLKGEDAMRDSQSRTDAEMREASSRIASSISASVGVTMTEEVWNSPPLPAIAPELPTGSVSPASSLYLERAPYDSRCYQEIAQPGALICLKAPRQMGKTSLMNRILSHAATLDYNTVLLDFQQADTEILSDLDRLLRWFCASLARQLHLDAQLDNYWDEDLGSKMSCTCYLQEYLLLECDRPLVIALEEVSTLFETLSVAQQFFSLIRSWHEKTKINPLWQKLRLILVNSTESFAYIPIIQSLFNVGLEIELPPFNCQQVQELAERHGLSLSSEPLKMLMAFSGGHPYLVRLTLYHMLRTGLTLEEFLKNATSDTGFYSDHLYRYWWYLQQRPQLIAAFQKVLDCPQGIKLDTLEGFQLKSLGLIKWDGSQASISCNLYWHYFSHHLR